MKSLNRNIVLLAALGVTVVLAGCTSFTKGYSQNPLAPSTTGTAQLFVGSQGAFDEFMEGFPAQLSAIWAQQLTGASAQFSRYQIYGVNALDFSNDWGTAYSTVLYDLRLTEQNAAKGGQYNQEGAALILEGMQMGTVTALWGSVPYSQAAEPNVTTTPKFDPQVQAYSEAQAALDSGIALLKAHPANLPGDIFSSQGSYSEWIAAAYTEKARLEMEMARHDGYSQADLNNVISWAEQGITDVSGAQDLMFVHTGGVYNGDMNLWNSFGTQDRPGDVDAASTFLVPMLEAYNMGNQLTFYYDTSASDLNYGAGFSSTASFPIFRASEANLLIAEAYAREGDLSSARTYLNNAIQYNDNVYGDSVAAYAASDPAVNTQEAMLQTVFNEEYMSLFPEIEAFTFLRRVDFDIKYTVNGTTVQLKPTTGTQFPQRLLYPSNEATANPNTPPEPSVFKATTVNSAPAVNNP